MESQRVEEYFVKMVELYSSIKSDLQHMVTKEELLEHSANCPTTKRHRHIVLIASMFSGAGLLLGLVIKSLI